jgi:hypothetical protein
MPNQVDGVRRRLPMTSDVERGAAELVPLKNSQCQNQCSYAPPVTDKVLSRSGSGTPGSDFVVCAESSPYFLC